MIRVAFILAISLILNGSEFGEDFYKIKQISVQKERFSKILAPIILRINNEILEERAFVDKFFKDAHANFFRNISKDDLAKLIDIKNKYKIEQVYDYHTYMKRINEIPISLALAQGAIESGWGKSRFAKEANNLFGHWTWGEKGIVPKEREEGKTHKIRIFDSLEDSVREYALNLNTNRAYKDFRSERLRCQNENIPFDGLIASKTMINYSQIKERYVVLLENTIKSNNFERFDEPSYRSASLIASD